MLHPDFFWCPLLMIAIIDAIDSKILTRNYIVPSEKLEHTYQSHIFTHKGTIIEQPSMAVPFYQLQFSTFWELRWRRTQLADIHITNTAQLREHIYGAVLSEELFPLLLMPSTREKLKQALIHSYLPDRLST
jgi:predicted restriction endonuclease